jgi:Zn finger protein HypA/HybF involved in hydrogenase expression
MVLGTDLKGLNAESELSISFLIRNFAYEKLTKIVSIQERFSNHYFFDPPVDKEIPVPYANILNALTVLENWGFMTSSKSVTRYCVECFTMGLNVAGRCPFCGSTRIRKGKIFAHKCGYRGFEEIFRMGDKWVCPKCQKQLYMEGGDYKDEGSQFKCMTCGNIFEKYATFYQCPNCHTYYEEEQAPSIEFNVYTPSSQLIAKKGVIKNTFNVTERVAQYLQRSGLESKMYSLMEMKEEYYYWDVLATRGEKGYAFTTGVNSVPLYDEVDEALGKDIMEKKEKSGLSTALFITPAVIPKELVTGFNSKGIYFVDPRFETLMNDDVLKEYVSPLLRMEKEKKR